MQKEEVLRQELPVICFYKFFEIPIVDIAKQDNHTFHTPMKGLTTNPDLTEFEAELRALVDDSS